MDTKRDNAAHENARAQTTIRLPADLKERIQQEADRDGQSFNAEVLILLRRGLEAE